MPTIRRGERGQGTGRGRRPSVKKATAAQKARKPSARRYATGSRVAVKPSVPQETITNRGRGSGPRPIKRGERGPGTGSSRRPSVRAATAVQRSRRPSRTVGLKKGGRVSKSKGGKAKR